MCLALHTLLVSRGRMLGSSRPWHLREQKPGPWAYQLHTSPGKKTSRVWGLLCSGSRSQAPGCTSCTRTGPVPGRVNTAPASVPPSRPPRAPVMTVAERNTDTIQSCWQAQAWADRGTEPGARSQGPKAGHPPPPLITAGGHSGFRQLVGEGEGYSHIHTCVCGGVISFYFYF